MCSAHDHETDRAGDGARTRDIKLGRLALYQLSYSRDLLFTPMKNRRFRLWFAQPRAHGGGRIRTFEGVSRQIYSLLPLAAWVPHRIRASAPATPALSASDDNRVSRPRADGGNRTHNRRFTKPELCRLSYVSNGVFARDSYNKRAGNQCQAARLRGVRARWRSPLALRARSCSS